MIRRDFLQAEISKLAQALAKIMGLKEAGNQQEADDLINQNLLQGFDLDLESVTKSSPVEFKKLLAAKNFPAKKLDLLGRFLLESVSPFHQNPGTIAILNHVLVLYQLLEQEHHTQSLENLNRQQKIIQFLKQKEQDG
ncbi:hypothetical protein [Mucilaginibacter arboris]|uniref:Uncharacterized protein n=1 Tax=Mucilaginibacter arboris TaxID=2682090 RepID=A0A7K1T1W1_9SPHI|nr:hypothetical protein [Mucilaginibacter arboris]MVN23508.1 hypothetical protein [Mucilaginibacter arboris]